MIDRVTLIVSFGAGAGVWYVEIDRDPRSKEPRDAIDEKTYAFLSRRA